MTSKPKVTDFGLAKLLLGSDSVSVGLSGTSTWLTEITWRLSRLKDTPRRLDHSPTFTRLGANSSTTARSRVSAPFLGESHDGRTLRLVTSSEVVPPRALRPDVARDLDTICLKCLDKDPQKALLDAAEALGADLRRFREGRSVLARRASAPDRAFRWCP